MEYALGNIFIRQMEGQEGFSVGHMIDGHTHNFDHTTIFFLGRWRLKKWHPAVDADGKQLTMPDGELAWVMSHDREIEAPYSVLIDAGARHEFTFLGCPIPGWMEAFLTKLPPEDAIAFRTEHLNTLGKAWCIYAHRTPQGDVVQQWTGWPDSYL